MNIHSSTHTFIYTPHIYTPHIYLPIIHLPTHIHPLPTIHSLTQHPCTHPHPFTYPPPNHLPNIYIHLPTSYLLSIHSSIHYPFTYPHLFTHIPPIHLLTNPCISPPFTVCPHIYPIHISTHRCIYLSMTHPTIYSLTLSIIHLYTLTQLSIYLPIHLFNPYSFIQQETCSSSFTLFLPSTYLTHTPTLPPDYPP